MLLWLGLLYYFIFRQEDYSRFHHLYLLMVDLEVDSEVDLKVNDVGMDYFLNYYYHRRHHRRHRLICLMSYFLWWLDI